MLLPELHCQVGSAHARTDAKLVNNLGSVLPQRVPALSTQAGTDPKLLSSSLVPTHLRRAGRPEIFHPGIPARLNPIVAVLP